MTHIADTSGIFPLFYLIDNEAKISLPHIENPISATNAFIIGAFANAIATLITYPIQVVQATMRVSSLIF